MPHTRTNLFQGFSVSLLSGLAAATAVLMVATFSAAAFRGSELYSKSRVISMIVSQDSVGVTDIAGNKRNVDMMLKFAGALTSAYINFELIPVNEVSTFGAVFQSVPAGVDIDKFEYKRKNLSIVGAADTEEEYEKFIAELTAADYFEDIYGHYYLATDGLIHFEIECTSQAPSVYIEFPQVS